MDVKILGMGCPNCKTLEENTRDALEQMGVSFTLAKITQMEEIMAYGVLSTPGIVVNEKVVSSGKLLSSKEIYQLLKGVEK